MSATSELPVQNPTLIKTRSAFVYRRDKYMFHQANVISTTWESAGDLAVDPVPTDNPSLLQYWYVRVLAKMAKFINTPVFPIEVRKRARGQ